MCVEIGRCCGGVLGMSFSCDDVWGVGVVLLMVDGCVDGVWCGVREVGR